MRNRSINVEDDVALITGAAGTLGAATARRLAAGGARVALADVRGELLEELASELDGIAIVLDVTSERSWSRAIDQVLAWAGTLTVLVNCAGLGEAAGLTDLALERWEELVAVNQTGVLLGMRAAAEPMRAAGRGSIVNVSSVHGLVARMLDGPGESAIAYAATKGAVRLMTKAAAVDLAPNAVRVNSVHPGYVDAPMHGVAPSGARSKAKERTPLGRLASPQEVASVIAFIASEEASYMTGSEVVVDGGFTAV